MMFSFCNVIDNAFEIWIYKKTTWYTFPTLKNNNFVMKYQHYSKSTILTMSIELSFNYFFLLIVDDFVVELSEIVYTWNPRVPF